jgi:DNA repair exonuclease SbcCD nuclease subunit
MKEKVLFSSLKRREIRRVIEIGENGENPILIYNPSPEKRKEIEKIIVKSFTGKNKEFDISPETVILDLLSLTTNVELDLHRDNEEDMILIKGIIEDPDPVFEETISEVIEVVKEIAEKYIKTLNKISSLPKEEIEKLIPKIETPEEKEAKELKERLKQLEDKINNKEE